MGSEKAAGRSIGLPIGGDQLTDLGGVFTTGRDRQDLLAEIGELHMQLADLQQFLAPYLWLEQQEAISTPAMFWMKSSGRTLADKIREVQATEDLKTLEFE